MSYSNLEREIPILVQVDLVSDNSDVKELYKKLEDIARESVKK